MLPRKISVLVCFLLAGVVGLSFTKFNRSFKLVGAPAIDTVTVCGTSTTLSTHAVAGFSNPIWNDGTSGTSLTVNASGDYWWQVTGTNVVTNGDFSAATTNSNTRGFTSAYTFKATNSNCNNCCCGVLSLEGTYTITTNPQTIHSAFANMGDHTTGSGKMLIVNGASTANTTVWTQNINVTPFTDYVFSVWVSSVHPTNPAQLQFSINGSPLGSTIVASTTTDNWQYFTTTWYSGSSSGSLPIALVNQNIATNGNDFAVDDIVFAPVYRQNVHVVLNPIPILTLNTPYPVCGTYNLTQAIVGYDTNTYNYVFKDSNGNTITNPTVSLSGNYTITEQNKVTGCTSAPVQATVTINPNPQKPGITTL
jgi:hypothetical protein